MKFVISRTTPVLATSCSHELSLWTLFPPGIDIAGSDYFFVGQAIKNLRTSYMSTSAQVKSNQGELPGEASISRESRFEVYDGFLPNLPRGTFVGVMV